MLLKLWSCQRGRFVLRALHGSAQLQPEVPAVLNIVFSPGLQPPASALEAKAKQSQ